MNRTSLIAGVVAIALCAAAGPAFAGPAEDAFLAKLVGSWTGGGSIKGGVNGAMTCTLKFRATSAGVHYSGNCDVEDVGGQSFSGDLSYSDKTHQYQAVSVGGDVVVGVKHGGGVSFVGKLHGLAGTGTSTMTVTANRISIDTALVDSQSNKPSKSLVTFSK